MSATIYYQPTTKGNALNIGAPSSFMDALERAFGHRGPWMFTYADYYTLHGLAAGLDCPDQRAAVQELAEAVGQHGEIRVWPEY